jgi:hypothetical protein
MAAIDWTGREPQQSDFDPYIGQKGPSKVAHLPLERDSLRRFVQAIMDQDKLYFDDAHAAGTRYGKVIATPLYPVHAFRSPGGSADRLNAVQANPDHDGTDSSDGAYASLPKIDMPFKRLLNGGNEIEFHRCLALGEVAVATPRYANLQLKKGKSGSMLLVTIETEYRTREGELLLVNLQTLIWR